MTTMKQSDVAGLESTLLQLGFTKRRNDFALTFPETTWMVGLQKSSFGDDLYVNVGIVETKTKPIQKLPSVINAANFDIFFRLTDVVPEQ